MTKRRKVVLGVSGVLAILGLSFFICFLIASHATKAEWQSRLGQRTTVEQRSILNAIKNFYAEPLNFLPLSGLDNEMCAAAVVNAVNFILGKDRLKPVSAWLFGRDNAQNLELIYDRSKDFAIMSGRVVKRVDRRLKIEELIKDDGIYVLGYHYKETGSDAKIIAARAGLNSHLMLFLGEQDGQLMGYHLIHYPGEEEKNPVRVETLASVFDLLDLVYIWRVKGVTLPKEAPSVALINTAPPYQTVRGWINFAPRPFDYYVDTVSVWLHSLANGSGQFPVTVKLDRDVVEAPNGGLRFHGCVLGFYNGVPVYQHGGRSTRGEYGLQFECVEFVNRYYVSLGFDNLTKTGDADSYYWNAEDKGLERFSNGGSIKPEVDDILVFDFTNNDGNPGHVAVIYNVTDKYLCFVQQNTRNWRDCLPLKHDRDRWTVRIPSEKGKDYPATVIGWSRWK